MRTNWDYTHLANAYLERPSYSEDAIEAMLKVASIQAEGNICDVGAGVAHLTIPLATRGFIVDAVEPNDAMRSNGIQRTRHFKNVRWYEGTGEQTGRRDSTYSLVTFGSSFNVCDRVAALRETDRILNSSGWFACMWNHRDLEDPIQMEIEKIIATYVEGYSYGTRREDQESIIDATNLFGSVVRISSKVRQMQTIKGQVEAWKSHATLARQAGPKFNDVIKEITDYLCGIGSDRIEIPYTTNIWMAQK